MKKIIFAISILFFASCQNPETNSVTKEKANDVPKQNSTIGEGTTVMTPSDFKKYVNSSDVVLVDFSATWCGPCKKLAPILDEIASEKSDDMKLVKSDVDRDSDLADSMNISAMPTLMLYKQGKLIWRNEGISDGIKEEISKKIDEARTQ